MTIVAAGLLLLAACSPAPAPSPPKAPGPPPGTTLALSGQASWLLPGMWRFETGRSGLDTELASFRVPYLTADREIRYSRAAVSADLVPETLTIGGAPEFQQNRIPAPEGLVVVDDALGGKWRTRLGVCHTNLVLERYGVDTGILVMIRLIQPVTGTSHFSGIEHCIANFNSSVRSLKIRGANEITSEVRMTNGIVWLQRLDAPSATPPANSVSLAALLKAQ